MRSKLLMIFVKNPIEGKVKTRLAKEVGNEQALNYYTQMLDHTASETCSVDADKMVYYSESIEENDQFDDLYFKKAVQHSGELGMRMQRAFEENFKKGYKRIIIVGSDCMDLEKKDLDEAFQLLAQKQVVMGPAMDGGYYLLGLNEPFSAIFRNKPWSTQNVFKKTYLEVLSGQKTIGLLGEKSDIDTFEDLKNSKLYQNKHELVK